MKDFDELAKEYMEYKDDFFDDWLEQSEDFEVNSVNELVEEFKE